MKPKNKRQRGQKEECGKESPTPGSKKSKISQQDKDQQETPAPLAKKRLTRKKEPKEKKVCGRYFTFCTFEAIPFGLTSDC